MNLVLWESRPVPYKEGELFTAIVTAHNDKQLIAQCTTLEFAEHIAFLHNEWVHRDRSDPNHAAVAAPMGEKEE
jgi:hypothetical protein